VHRRDLHEDVGAVAVLLDHLLQPAHLALDQPQSADVARLRGARIA
jgi:hypothetical protein